ncbi:MAG: class IV adenylate cyclase [Candidatus Bathyarchaeota archaeon]|nr:class IV adenylate cyclase [Candidatus Bathyarchaeum sp.]
MNIETQSSFKHKMVELKARVDDHDFLKKKLTELGAQYTGIFQQTDLYFVVPEGRLKLREVEGQSAAELIYYERENIAGPKQDDAFLLRIQEAQELKDVLKKILKPLIVINKVREIYQLKGTQIHLDTVKSLGKFVEFERQTGDKPSMVKRDQQVLEELRKTLEISANNLETLSYSDLAEAQL